MRIRRPSSWWAAAALLVAAAFGTNVSTPLLLIYRDRLDLSPSVLTAIFGVYALGLAPSLLFGGPASDRYGRTRVLLPATALVAVASLLFLAGENSVPMLFVARFVQGLASGAAFSVGSAWLQDLVGADRASVAARHGSLALNIGFCLGPLSAGLLGQYGPRPLVVPYLLHVVIVLVLLIAAVLIARGGEWAAGRRGASEAPLFPRPQLGPAGRRVFAQTLIPTAICVYAFPSVAVTVLPLPLRHVHHAVAFTGVLAAVTLGSGALIQPTAEWFGTRRAPVGAGLGAVGYGLGAISAATATLPLAVVAGALLGAGGGLCLNAGLVLVQQLSGPTTRGATNGLFYTWAYVGFAMPLLTTSFVTTARLDLPLSALTAASAATAVWLLISPRPFQPVAAEQH